MPKDKPILLAPNHPNSFIDGILLSVLLRRKLNLLARGDVFKKPLANWALRSMRVLPIFRYEDGAGAHQGAKNQATYNECHEIFAKNGMVLIFPEGYCVSEWRLRPLKKGAAKLAFEAIEKYPDMDLLIVPVGLNYSNPGHFREDVCINFGQPIAVKSFLPLLQSNQQTKAITQLNTQLYEAMEREMIIINEPANDLIAKNFLQMARNKYKPSFFGFFKKTKHRFIAEKRAANDLNNLSSNHLEEFESFRRKINDYFASLSDLRIKDKYFALALYEKIWHLLFMLVFALPSLLGLILNFIPIRMAKKLAIKKVKKVEFYDSVFIGIGSLLGFIYSLILLIICTSIFGTKGILISIGLRLLGYLYLFWHETYLNSKYWLLISLTAKGRRLNTPLRSQRHYLLNFFEPKF